MKSDNSKKYEPVTEIVIHIGEKGECTDLDKIRVYVDGEKIENLRGFSFLAELGKPPEVIIRKSLYKQQSFCRHE